MRRSSFSASFDSISNVEDNEERRKRAERLVFVDPDDAAVAYWWPAIVLPPLSSVSCQ